MYFCAFSMYSFLPCITSNNTRIRSCVSCQFSLPLSICREFFPRLILRQLSETLTIVPHILYTYLKLDTSSWSSADMNIEKNAGFWHFCACKPRNKRGDQSNFDKGRARVRYSKGVLQDGYIGGPPLTSIEQYWDFIGARDNSCQFGSLPSKKCSSFIDQRFFLPRPLCTAKYFCWGRLFAQSLEPGLETFARHDAL